VVGVAAARSLVALFLVLTPTEQREDRQRQVEQRPIAGPYGLSVKEIQIHLRQKWISREWTPELERPRRQKQYTGYKRANKIVQTHSPAIEPAQTPTHILNIKHTRYAQGRAKIKNRQLKQIITANGTGEPRKNKENASNIRLACP